MIIVFNEFTNIKFGIQFYDTKTLSLWLPIFTRDVPKQYAP